MSGTGRGAEMSREYQDIVLNYLHLHYGVISMVLAGIISLLVMTFIIVYMTGAASAYQQAAAELKAGLVRAYNNRIQTEKYKLSYNSKRAELDCLGVTYYTKGKLTPIVCMIYKAAVPFAALIAAVTLNRITPGVFIPALVAALILMYAAPKAVAQHRNKRDNELMLPSIIDIYDIILLQLNSGEYITQVIIDAYRVATNRRLKTALIELTGDIMSSNNLVLSMEVFGGKFDNSNIANLVALVKQMAETGATVDMLSDIKRRLFNLQKNYNDFQKDRMNGLGFICAFLIFVVVIAIMGYLCIAAGPDVIGIFMY